MQYLEDGTLPHDKKSQENYELKRPDLHYTMGNSIDDHSQGHCSDVYYRLNPITFSKSYIKVNAETTQAIGVYATKL